MRAVAFWFKSPAAFEHDHAEHKQEKSHTYPINFFHNQKSLFTFTKANVNPNAVKRNEILKPLPHSAPASADGVGQHYETHSRRTA